MKRPLEKPSTLVYNLHRTVIGCDSDLNSVKIVIIKNSILTLDGVGCYFFLSL